MESTPHRAKRIRHLRIALGMTQAQLAESLEMQQRMVSYWETGRNTPRTPDLVPLCRALHTTPNALLGWDEKGDHP